MLDLKLNHVCKRGLRKPIGSQYNIEIMTLVTREDRITHKLNSGGNVPTAKWRRWLGVNTSEWGAMYVYVSHIETVWDNILANERW